MESIQVSLSYTSSRYTSSIQLGSDKKKVHLIPIEHKFAAKASEMYIRSTCLPQSHGSKSKQALFFQHIDSKYDNLANSKSYKIKEA